MYVIIRELSFMYRVVPTHVLDSGQKIGARTDKQTFTLQDHPKTYMDVRRNHVGHSLSFEHRNPAEILEQSPQDVSQRPLVHTKQSPTHRSTDRCQPFGTK
jgi:hypothetical protein